MVGIDHSSRLPLDPKIFEVQVGDASQVESSAGDISHKQQNFKKAQLKALRSGKPFVEMSNKFRNDFKLHMPEKFKEMEDFKEKHKEALSEVEEKGWNKLKKEYGEGMEDKIHGGTSFDELRNSVVKLVIGMSLEAVKMMGYEDPGGHLAIGTPGYGSDIDTVYIPSKGSPVPEEVQAFEKIAFDMIMLANFGDLPGDLFDTESYLNHSGAAFATESNLQTESGKEKFARVEVNAAFLQTLRQLGPESSGWDDHKELQLSGLSDEKREALSNSFDDVERFQKDVDKGVEIQMLT
jgi:hypothetical protein